MLPNNCDIVIVMALWAGRRLKDMDKMKQVAPEVLSQPELLVSCFWNLLFKPIAILFQNHGGRLSI